MPHARKTFTFTYKEKQLIVEDSAKSDYKVFIHIPEGSLCYLTAEEARDLGMELIHRASDSYVPSEDED